MLEITKKILISALIKLRIIKKIEDKNEKDLTPVHWFIVFFITSCLKDTVS
ncbi:hypothetical protein [Candidatus Clostridium radicumherbarum]|uniref:Transposase n=1 Tax=Candidatus Clostridium radicumherbarum TaxID=3381662 RepID=A0ABW8TSM9_9CLOT